MRYLFNTFAVLSTIAVAYSALAVKPLSCEGGCGKHWEGWAWQWNATALLGVSMLVVACILCVLMGRADARASTILLLVQAAFGGLLVLLAYDGGFGHPAVVLGIFAPVAFGAAALATIQRPAGVDGT